MEQLKSAININELSFAYNGSLILDKVNANIQAEKLTFVLGQNGCGKSTLLKIIAGLLRAQNGTIKLFDNYSSKLSFAQQSKLMGFLNQQHKAVFPFSVEDVVLTGRTRFINYIPKNSDKQATIQALDKAGILHLRKRNYTELSGGEQQMVMVARLLAQNPKILLLDEPTTHLDLSNQSDLLNLFKRLVNEGMTIVAVMHDPNLAFLFGDDFLFIKDRNVIRPNERHMAWDNGFLKSIYHDKIETISHNGRALIVPQFN